MDNKLLARVGTICFAGWFAVMGVQNLMHRSFVGNLFPLPEWLAREPLSAVVGGLLFLAAAFCIVSGIRAYTASTVLALVLVLLALVLHGPKVLANPHNGGAWTLILEFLALAGGALIVSGRVAMGRTLYGATLFGFAWLHFVYGEFIATLIPAWLPARAFLAYAVGVAFLAAAIAIVWGRMRRLALIGLAAMFGTWVVILHAPRVLAHVDGRDEWSSAFIALAMCGIALMCLASEPRRA